MTLDRTVTTTIDREKTRFDSDNNPAFLILELFIPDSLLQPGWRKSIRLDQGINRWGD